MRGDRGHLPVQLPGAAGPAQARPGAGRRERGRLEAGPEHAADRPRPGRLLHRRRPAQRRPVGAHGSGRSPRQRAGQRPEGAQGLVHGVHRDGRAHHPRGRGQEAVTGAWRVQPGGDTPRCRHRARGGRNRGRRLRERRAGMHLGSARDRPPEDQRRLPRRACPQGRGHRHRRPALPGDRDGHADQRGRGRASPCGDRPGEGRWRADPDRRRTGRRHGGPGGCRRR